MVPLESPRSQLSIEHNIVCFGGDLVTKRQEEYRGDEEITTHLTPDHVVHLQFVSQMEPMESCDSQLHVKPIMKTIGNELMEIWGKRACLKVLIQGFPLGIRTQRIRQLCYSLKPHRGDNRDMAMIKDPGMPPSRNLTEVVSGCCSGPSPPLVLLPEATQRWKQQGNGDS
ncbi:hypothetical protein BS47DRAFT_1361978 [Hydnum rufescens UP504]|uniref:Uncharacterized protein n=1 Tax=Hydnum rufescens UP504 TaxID=1448309 RepID=A0A9P6AXV3_9AGAM|nr:hypothetical protein BS47DRAFT_1361978 [Hydnum rufescens UP504]